MDPSVVIEVVGLRDSHCSPFPCDETRSCGLSACHPSGKLPDATDALRDALADKFGARVQVILTFIDDEIPPRIKQILEERSPPLPIILVNGRLTPFGRVSLIQIEKEIQGILA